MLLLQKKTGINELIGKQCSIIIRKISAQAHGAGSLIDLVIESWTRCRSPADAADPGPTLLP